MLEIILVIPNDAFLDRRENEDPRRTNQHSTIFGNEITKFIPARRIEFRKIH